MVHTAIVPTWRTLHLQGLVLFALLSAALVPNIALAQADAKKDKLRIETTRFAPGVVRVVPPAAEPVETFTGPFVLQSLLDDHPEIQWKGENFPDGRPNFDPKTVTLDDLASRVILRREVHSLEFSFKPLRTIQATIPGPNGQMQNKVVWYMVYRVRYVGDDLRPGADIVGDKQVYQRIEKINYQSRRAMLSLVLADKISGKEYLDRLLPSVTQQIQRREQITVPLYDTMQLSQVAIPRSSDADAAGVWGVATWEDVDPSIDFLSIYIEGLTNAFQPDGEGEGAKRLRKQLQLNWHRPGDTANLTADKVRFGIPAFRDADQQQYVLKQYGMEERLDYRWTFR